MTTRFGTLALCACILAAQDKKAYFEPAPPEVDAALRARITGFYQVHVDGKYRLADQYVAEESKDAYFAMAKPKYLSFEVARVSYLDSKFTTAEALVNCKVDWFFQGEKLKINMPATSQWKSIGGEWFIYFPAIPERQTPFGVMHAGDGKDPQGKIPSGPILPADPRTLAKQILEAVRTDRSEVSLSGYQADSAEVKITNGMQGPITLSVSTDGAPEGLTYTLDKTTVPAGESAILKFVYNPKDRAPKPALTARIVASPLNQVLPVRLSFTNPPEPGDHTPKAVSPKPEVP